MQLHPTGLDGMLLLIHALYTCFWRTHPHVLIDMTNPPLTSVYETSHLEILANTKMHSHLFHEKITRLGTHLNN